MFAYFDEEETSIKFDGVITRHYNKYYTYESSGKCWKCGADMNTDLDVCIECNSLPFSQKFKLIETEENKKNRRNVEKQIKLQLKKYVKSLKPPPFQFDARIEPEEVRKIYGDDFKP